MKKILSLAVILVALGAVVTATRAYFSSEVTQNNVTFSTGTLVINDVSEDWMLPVTFTNLKPGDTVRKWVVIKNEGTLDVDLLYVNKANVVDSSGLLGQILVSATGRVGSADPAYFTDDWGTKPTVAGWFSNSDMLDGSYYRTPAGVIRPGEVYTMTFDFTVPTTVGNEFQGKTATFDLVFHGEQVH